MAKQRKSLTMMVTFDIVSELPENATHADVVNEIESYKITLEREVTKAIQVDYGYQSKAIVTEYPKFK